MQNVRYWLRVAYPVQEDRVQHDELQHELVDPRQVQRFRRPEVELEVREPVAEVFCELLQPLLLDELGEDLRVGHQVDREVRLSVGVVLDAAA